MSELLRRIQEASAHVAPRWTMGREQAVLERAEGARRWRRVTTAATALAVVVLVCVGVFRLEVLLNSETLAGDGSATAARVSPESEPAAGAEERAMLQFEDGSQVRALSKTTETHLVRSSRTESVVALDAGEARFEVTPGTGRRFRVVASPIVVTVLGTVFDVTSSAESVRVSVARGLVRVDSPAGSWRLAAGEEGTFGRSSGGQAGEEQPGEAQQSGDERLQAALQLATKRDVPATSDDELVRHLKRVDGARSSDESGDEPGVEHREEPPGGTTLDLADREAPEFADSASGEPRTSPSASPFGGAAEALSELTAGVGARDEASAAKVGPPEAGSSDTSTQGELRSRNADTQVALSESSSRTNLKSRGQRRQERRWVKLAGEGAQGEAYVALKKDGSWSTLTDTAQLMLAADVARGSGDFKLATAILGRVVTLHPRDGRAPLAAFTMGKLLLERLGSAGRAARAFARVRQLAPQGPLAEDALAREVEALARSGAVSEANSRAELYFSKYPKGRRRSLVERYAK